jgi:hypothetical protein
MKASAFSTRRDHTNKDWEDLVLLRPTKEEIESAIEFIKESNAPAKSAPAKIIEEFEETLDDLSKITN